jgi:hypothetical protein
MSNEVDRTAGGILAVAFLGPAQHLDPLEVVELDAE